MGEREMRFDIALVMGIFVGDYLLGGWRRNGGT